MKILCAIILCMLEVPDTVNPQNVTHMANLHNKLFVINKYNKNIRPLLDQHEVLDISVDFYLNTIIDFQEKEGSITIAGYLSFEWTDEFLIWDPADYDEIEIIFIPQNQIWKPDVALRNSFDTFSELGSKYFNVWITNTGIVTWEPYQVFKSTCDADIKYFPFDIQICKLEFNAWSYNKYFVNMSSGSKGIVRENYNENSVWNLIDSKADTEKSQDTVVLYTLVLQRKPLYFIVNIVVPTVLLSVLDIFVFMLPITSGERAGFAITVFLSFAVFNTIVSAQLPANSDFISYLGIYLVSMNALSTLVVLVSLILQRIDTRDEDTDQIGSGYIFIHKFVQALRCKICSKKRKVASEENKRLLWTDVIESLDFLLFWITLLITIAATVVLLVMASSGTKPPQLS